MTDYNKTINFLLESKIGFTPGTLNFRLIEKKLAKNIRLQHFATALELELLTALERDGQKLPGKRRDTKCRDGQTLPRERRNSKSMELISDARKVANLELPELNIKLRVPNLTVGKPFKETIIPLDDLPSGSLRLFMAKGHESVNGLLFSDSDFSISGVIDQGGTHDIVLFCNLLLPNGASQTVIGALKITVIPDPRSLWKTLPSNTSERFHKPDVHSMSLETDTALLLGSSVRGRSHAHKGTHRDDDLSLSTAGSNGWNVICVADGAGSCKFSRRGAEIAAKVSTRSLSETLDGHYGEKLEAAYENSVSENPEKYNHELQEMFQHTIVKAVHDATKSISDAVNKDEGDKLKDFSTTLLLAAYKAVKGGHLVLYFGIGDGGAVVYDKGINVQLLGEPDSGEYAGQTRFLDNKIFQDSSVYSRIKIEKFTSMTALILATDGITDAWFDTEKQLSAIEPWDQLWSELEPFVDGSDLKKGELGLTKWMDFWSAGNHDDRTIAICSVKVQKLVDL